MRGAACFYCVMVPLVDLRCSKPEPDRGCGDGGDILYLFLLSEVFSRIKAPLTLSHEETP